MAEDRDEGREERPELTAAQRAALLQMARRTVESYVKEKVLPRFESEEPALEEPRAAFVTLTRKGKLRGCIGYSEPLYSLRETVIRCAVASATQDYRFPPVAPEEIPELRISISALTPLRRLGAIERLDPGRHGLLIVGKDRRGLLLPQVAAERGWDRETFLRETCRKAGLPDDAWKRNDVEIWVFEAEVFYEGEASEDSPGRSPGGGGFTGR